MQVKFLSLDKAIQETKQKEETVDNTKGTLKENILMQGESQCKTCEKRFYTERYLDLHILNHHEERNESEKNLIECEKTFPTRYNLKNMYKIIMKQKKN